MIKPPEPFSYAALGARLCPNYDGHPIFAGLCAFVRGIAAVGASFRVSSHTTTTSIYAGVSTQASRPASEATITTTAATTAAAAATAAPGTPGTIGAYKCIRVSAAATAAARSGR